MKTKKGEPIESRPTSKIIVNKMKKKTTHKIMPANGMLAQNCIFEEREREMESERTNGTTVRPFD